MSDIGNPKSNKRPPSTLQGAAGAVCSSGSLSLVVSQKNISGATTNCKDYGCVAVCPLGHTIIGAGCSCGNVLSKSTLYDTSNPFYVETGNGQGPLPNPNFPSGPFRADSAYCACNDKSQPNFAIAYCCGSTITDAGTVVQPKNDN